jgi:chromate transporter
MIALLENEFVSKKKWMEKEEFLDMVAISESTPGPIAINAATYIGYKSLGFGGALLATAGVALPSFVIIFCISLFFDAFLSLTLVARAFRGIQVCVIYLILSAGLKLLHGMKKTPLSLSVVSLTVLTMVSLSLLAVRFSSVLLILII